MIGIVLGTLAIVGVTIVIGVLVDRKVGLFASPADFETEEDRARKQRVTHGAGEAPGTALRLRDAQLATLRGNQRCPRCKELMREESDSPVRYDHRELRAIAFSCPRCKALRSLYVERAD